jgi:hypothetical protein
MVTQILTRIRFLIQPISSRLYSFKVKCWHPKLRYAWCCVTVAATRCDAGSQGSYPCEWGPRRGIHPLGHGYGVHLNG